MKFPEKKSVVIAGEEFNIIPYLTLVQVREIIGGCIDVFDNGLKIESGEIVTDIKSWDKSLILMERNFNAFLIETCIDVKDLDYDVAVANGVVDFLYENVINAEATLEKIYQIIEKRDSLPYVTEKAINKIIEKIPTAKGLEKLYSTVKKDMTSGKFNESFDKIKNMFEVNKTLGK